MLRRKLMLGDRRAVAGAVTTLLAVAGLLWLHATVARAATTRFVVTAAHGGNDNGGSNDCSNQATPCLTIQNAISHAVNGDTIQIGPGLFATSVTSTGKALTFAGAGAGTLSAPFDPATETGIDAVATSNPAFRLGNRSTTFENLRVRGGLEPDGMGGDVKPAIDAVASTGPTVTVTDSILLQAAPPSPDVREYALVASGIKVVVRSSTVVGYENGVRATGTGGALTIDQSSVLTPAPANPGLSAGIRAAVETLEPTLITDSRLVGIAGLYDQDATATVLRTFIGASGGGAGLRDNGLGGSLALRDSIVEGIGDPPVAATGVDVSSASMSEVTPPSLTLVGDTVLARGAHGPSALELQSAAAGTHVNTRNTILRAIDTSGGNANNDIEAGTQAIDWNVGYTDFTEVKGLGVPAPGSGTNINAPPGFVDDSGANLHLAPSSTLFDKGDPSVVAPGETDITGAPRSVPHVCGGAATPDLGAYEAPTPSCPPPSGGQPPPPPPAITHFAQSHKKWRTGTKVATITAKRHKRRKHTAPVGTRFTFTLNTASEVTLTFTKSTAGRKVKGKCVAQTRRNKHKRSCKRTVPAGTLTFPSAAAGTDSIAFAGKVAGNRKLKPGKYTVAVEATNSTGHSAQSKLSFTVVKR